MLSQKRIFIFYFFSASMIASVRDQEMTDVSHTTSSKVQWEERAHEALKKNHPRELSQALEHLEDPIKNNLLRRIIKSRPDLMETALQKGIAPYLKGDDGITLTDFVVLRCTQKQVQLFLAYVLRQTNS